MIKVSFCIPVNNKERALKIAKFALNSDSMDYQVVFSDNCSVDGTYDALKAIDDPRLKVVRLEKPVSPMMNWYNALKSGDGEWLYLVMGRDRLHPENIDRLYKLLDECPEDINCLLDRTADRDIDILEGKNAIIRFVEINHETGTMVRKAAFDTYKNIKSFFETDFCFPEVFLRGRLLKNNLRGGVVSSGVYFREAVESIGVYSSGFSRETISNLYWMPEERYKQEEILTEFTDKEFDISDDVKNEIFENHIKTLLSYITHYYYWAYNDYFSLRHYGVKQRMISSEELNDITSKYRDKLLERYKGNAVRENIIRDEFVLKFDKEYYDYISQQKKWCLQRMSELLISNMGKQTEYEHGKTYAIFGGGDLGKILGAFLTKTGNNVYYIDDTIGWIFALPYGKLYSRNKESYPCAEVLINTTSMDDEKLEEFASTKLNTKVVNMMDFILNLSSKYSDYFQA